MNHKMVTACSTVQIMQVRDKGVPSSYHSKWWSVFVEWWLHHCSPLPCIVESIPYVITVFTRTRYTDRHRTHTHTNRTQRGRHTHTQAQTLLHTDPSTHRRFHTKTLLQKNRCFYTQTLLHTEAFTYKSFYTQTLLHTKAFIHTRAKGLRANLQNRNFTSVLDTRLDHHFMRKGCAQTCEIAILLHALTSKRMNQSSRPPMPCRHTESTMLPQISTIELHFVGKGCAGP